MAGRTTKTALILVLGLAAQACAGGGTSRDDAFRNAVPSREALSMAMPGGSDGSTEGGARAALIGETAVLYGHTRNAIDGVNLYVRALGSVLDDVFDTTPVWRDSHTAVFGPFGDALEPAIFVVIVSSDDDVHFNYVILGKPRHAGDDELAPVLAGTSESAGGESVRGALVIDGAKLHELDAIRNPDRATVWIEYDLVSRPVGLHVAAQQADAPAPGVEPQAVDFRHVRNADGSGAVLLASHGGLDEAGAAAPDYYLGTMWNAFGEGRSDFAQTGGPLGDTVGTAVECWDGRFGRTFLGDGAGPIEGTPDACVFSTSLFDVVAMASGGST